MQDRNMDDFSFPAIPTDQDSVCQQSFPHFAASPLWFLSSAAPDEDNTTDCQLRRSLSSTEDTAKIVDALNTAAAAARSDDEGSSRERLCDSENKMDMLWEDFNEELRRVSCEVKKDATGKATGEQQVLGLSKVCGRRASLVVMLNMLKRLFLLQKTNSTKRSLPFKKL